MRQSIRVSIYQAIIEEHWLEINYTNSNGEETNFYIGIKDIDVDSGKISCEIFNCFKSNKCFNHATWIKVDSIKSARIIEQSYYPLTNYLSRKINTKKVSAYLEVESIDNNILKYLSDCYELDNDPYLKESIMLDGVDFETLTNEGKYQLDQKQFDLLVETLFKKPSYEADRIYRKQDLAFNIFSIDLNNRQYVVAYRSLYLNFKNRTLKLNDVTSINKSFLVEEDKKVTLGMYLDANPEDFCLHFDEYKEAYINGIKENFRNNELVNTRPTLFLLDRKIVKGVDQAFEAINELEQDNKLTYPIKSFFGRNRTKINFTKEPNIVVFNRNKINIDQLRVVYNSMANHVTYVKGPPGTGKTETIFNVLLSAYANDMKVLVCSNNNHPVNDIFSKMITSFKTDYDFYFPIIRIGNNNEMIETIYYLRNIYQFINNHKNDECLESNYLKDKELSMSGYDELRNLLKQYEERIELIERIEKLIKISYLTTADNIKNGVIEQINAQQEKLDKYPFIKNEDVTKYVISASEDNSFREYIYYSSLSKFKKLLNDTYDDLKEIVFASDIERSAIELNKYLRNDKNIRRFTDVFSIVVTTNLSSEKLGSAKQHFDLCIMDEAGQCNIASSLVPIIRADNLLLVGDTNQLQPVTVIETDVNDHLMEKYNIKPEYNYIKNSILSLMLAKDNNSKSILLSYHYRCGKKIAGFVNSRFYEKQLKLINQNDGVLTYYDVHNTSIPGRRNAYSEEARCIVDILKKNNYHDVGIITPFVNQAALINEYLFKAGINDIKAGTVHTLQGSEKPIIIVSAALSLKTGKRTMEWIKNNHELINVAVTRARERFIFVGDKNAIDLLNKNEISDIKALSDYVYSNGEYEVPKSSKVIMTDFSNDSQSEKDFFDTVTPYFNRRNTKFRITRNVPVKLAIKKIRQSDLSKIGKKEFDVAVEETHGISKRYNTICVFEIDGGEHISSKETALRDRQKEEICKLYGIKLIRISNNQVKDYELIIKVFESTINGLKDIDETQISLLEEEN